MRKKVSTPNIQIIFLGIGSYNTVKDKKSTKGLFWTINKDSFLLLDSRTSTTKELSFITYEALVTYCNKTFPNSNLTT